MRIISCYHVLVLCNMNGAHIYFFCVIPCKLTIYLQSQQVTLSVRCFKATHVHSIIQSMPTLTSCTDKFYPRMWCGGWWKVRKTNKLVNKDKSQLAQSFQDDSVCSDFCFEIPADMFTLHMRRRVCLGYTYCST